MLLIIDNNKNICNYFPSENIFLDTSGLSLIETLKAIQTHANVSKIYFPIELKFKGTYRQQFQGLELFKHIRLTPELGKLQFAPILLGFTYPLENILRNPENTILCSPATQLFNLKDVWHIKDCFFFQSKETLTKESLTPYVLFTETDEEVSDHDRRNEQGPLKLKQELEMNKDSPIEIDLWQKKVLFLQPDAKSHQVNLTFTDIDFKNTIKDKRILYLDDEANKWESVLKEVFEGATVDIMNNFSKIDAYIDELQDKQKIILDNYFKEDKNLSYLFYKNGANHQFLSKVKLVEGFRNSLSQLLNYDLVLLDVRLEKNKDKQKILKHFTGVQILQKLIKLNPFIPVVMFTASNKIENYRGIMKFGATEFWIKNVSSASELKGKAFQLLQSVSVGTTKIDLRDFHSKLLLIENRNRINYYFYHKKEKKIKVAQTPSNLIGRLNNAVNLFLIFMRKYVYEKIEKEDVTNLWKMTGDTLQIRVPAIYGFTEIEAKAIDIHGLIASVEYDYRWNRNYFQHNTVHDDRIKTLDPFDANRAIEYINHTIDFLLGYR